MEFGKISNLKIKKITPDGIVGTIANSLKENIPPFEGVADHHYVFGLWTDNKKNVFVALYGAGKVKKIDSAGEISTVFVSKEGWSPCGGLIDKNGNMWITEFSTRNKTHVRKIVSSGEDILYGS